MIGMFSLVVYLTSAILGSSLLSLQSPKLYNDSGVVIESTQELEQFAEKKVTKKEASNVKYLSREISQLSAVLLETAQGKVLSESSVNTKAAPAGISEGLSLWLRQDKNELVPAQVKTVQNAHFFGSNGASSQIIVYKDPGDIQQKILSFGDNGDEYYTVSVGPRIEVSKLQESKKWSTSTAVATQNTSSSSSQQENLRVLTVRTEDIFGITDVFIDGALLRSDNTQFKQHNPKSFGDVTLGNFSTDVREVIQFNRQISEDERRHIETYLRLKYDIHLDQATGDALTSKSGQLLWDPIENQLYSHNMMSLVKNISWDVSRNSAYQELTNESTISLSMLDDAPDETYVVTGDNGKSLAYSNSSHPAFAHMLQRTWKIENTGELKKISLTYTLPADFSGDATNSALVIGDNSDFSDDKLYLPASVDQNNITFQNVYIDEEAYFTFLFDKTVDDVTPFTSFQNVNSIDPSQVRGPGGVQQGLILWLRADTGVELENDHVIKWLDQSGNGNDLTADLPLAYGTAPTYIQNEINYYPTIRFNHDRLTDYLGRSNFDFTGESKNYTQFIVYKHNEPDNYGGVISYASKLDTNDFMLFNPAELWLFKNGREQRLNKNSADGLTHIVGVRNNELIGTTDISLDGSSTLFNYGTSGHEPGGTYVIGQDQDTVGGGFDPEQAFVGEVSEVILFHEALSDIDMLKIHTYLAFKYGITLPTMYVDTSEVLVWDDTKNIRYNNNVHGIGKDDVSGITQKISRSQDNSLITFKNPRNMDTGEYIMFGDNNGAAKITDTTIARTWFVQKKGDVGAIDISFDLRKIDGLDMNKQNSFILAVSADESFIQTKVFSENHIDGYTLTFKNVSFESGQYFSLKSYSPSSP